MVNSQSQSMMSAQVGSRANWLRAGLVTLVLSVILSGVGLLGASPAHAAADLTTPLGAGDAFMIPMAASGSSILVRGDTDYYGDTYAPISLSHDNGKTWKEVLLPGYAGHVEVAGDTVAWKSPVSDENWVRTFNYISEKYSERVFTGRIAAFDTKHVVISNLQNEVFRFESVDLGTGVATPLAPMNAMWDGQWDLIPGSDQAVHYKSGWPVNLEVQTVPLSGAPGRKELDIPSSSVATGTGFLYVKQVSGVVGGGSDPRLVLAILLGTPDRPCIVRIRHGRRGVERYRFRQGADGRSSPIARPDQ